MAQELTAALYCSGLRCAGVDWFLADGEPAGQEVFHVHLHVFPRYECDGFGFRFPPSYPENPSRAELEAIAHTIHAALES